MFRSSRSARSISRFLLALSLVLSAAAAAPATAQAPPGAAFLYPVPLIVQVDVVGAGPTEADALANALAELNASYFVLRYQVTRSFCVSQVLPGTDVETTVCAAEVHAWVLRKAIFLSH